MSSHWTTRTLDPTDLIVGPCAWRVTMLAGEAGGDAAYVHEHPSLVVVQPEDDDATLKAAAEHLGDLPVLLGVAEPTFARRFAGQVEQRLTALGRQQVDGLMLHVAEVTELKSGGLLQTMFALRERGMVRHLGLASSDPLAVEWLAANTAVRLLGVPWGLDEQTVRWRALERAAEYGMAALALTSPADESGLRFALAERERVLPVLDRALPEPLSPMPADEVEAAWAAYRSTHEPPAALPRSRPPMGEG